MADFVDPKAFLNFCEITIDNMYDLEAIGELLEQKGDLTKAEIIALAKKLKRKTPSTESRTAATIELPPQPRFTDTDNAVIEEIMAVLLQHGLSADQATSLLGRTIQRYFSRHHLPPLGATSRYRPLPSNSFLAFSPGLA